MIISKSRNLQYIVYAVHLANNKFGELERKENFIVAIRAILSVDSLTNTDTIISIGVH